jgi:hypothetical protein
MANERAQTVPPAQDLRHRGATWPLPAEPVGETHMLVILMHAFGVLQCVVQSTSSTPFRRLVSILVLVIVLVLAVKLPPLDLPLP